MNDFINQSEIEQLSDQELRVRFFEIFNALAQRQTIIQQYAEMQKELHSIQMTLYKRRLKL